MPTSSLFPSQRRLQHDVRSRDNRTDQACTRDGLVRKDGDNPELTINVPAGKIQAQARIEDGKVVESSFQNVPSFLYLRDRHVEVPGIGRVTFDVAYGGAFYAFVEASTLELSLVPANSATLIDYGRRIKHAVIAAFPIKHPFEEDLSFLYGTIFTGPSLDPAHHSRNVCIFADGELDRSATGSGASARAALHHAKGELSSTRRSQSKASLGAR